MKYIINETEIEVEEIPVEDLMADQHVANHAWLNGELSDDERDDYTRLNYLAGLE